jgi:hypothetical protein
MCYVLILFQFFKIVMIGSNRETISISWIQKMLHTGGVVIVFIVETKWKKVPLGLIYFRLCHSQSMVMLG